MTKAALTTLKPVEALPFDMGVPCKLPCEEELIRIENLHKTYHLGEINVPVLNGVSFSIRRGEMVALMGASGSGKTTLMNILGFLDRPSAGKYWFDGQEMGDFSEDQRALVRGAKIGFVFQNFNLLNRTTALNNVLMPLNYAVHGLSNAECKQRASQLLAHIGLEDRLDHEPSQLSGGQQQRVAIARSLVNMPELILADEPTGNLDSHTSVEILRTFQQLNAAGITVLLVTHDPKVASFAHRTIRITDGLVESDSASVHSPASSPHVVLLTSNSIEHRIGSQVINTNDPSGSTENYAPKVGPARRPVDSLPINSRLRSRISSSMILSALRTAATALRRNKLRSALTTLGIVIGIGAVIAMVEIGQGSSYAIQKTIGTLGANIVQIDPSGISVGGVNTGARGKATLTPQDCEAILQECSAVRWAAPSVDCRMQVVYGNRNWSPNKILGTTPEYLQIRNWSDLQEGAPFTDDDVRRAAGVCLIGQTPARELFQGESALGKTVRVKDVALRVVGVLSRKGANVAGLDQDDFILAPLTTIKLRLSGIRNTNNQPVVASSPFQQVNSLNQLYPTQQLQLYSQRTALQTLDTPQVTRFFDLDDIWVSASSPQDVPFVIGEVTNLLRERHRHREGEPDDFRIRDLTEISETLASTSKLMTELLLCVAVISLVVGGVGIMNIMLVSVTERTREIGLRMAVGARACDILWQFLVEAVLVCLAGGIAGIALGRGVAITITALLNWPTMPSLLAVTAAVAVSMIVGIVFGYYPAWKASRLDPIAALHYE